MIRVVRAALAVAGLAAVCFGVWSMRDFDAMRLRSVLAWLGGVVVVHDAVLAPVVTVLGVVATRVVPAGWRTPLTVAFILWGSLTLVALPALSGLGERPDNPTLLDRPYVAAWLVLSMVAVAAVPAYVGLRRGDRR